MADLTARVEREMLDNAALEESPDTDDTQDNQPYEGEDDDSGSTENSELSTALGDYLSDDDVPAYLQERADAGNEHSEIPLTGGSSAYDDLIRQIGEHDLSPHQRELMDYLIGSLDENGFLRKDLAALADELAIYQNIDTDVNELEAILAVLHTFEPRGIGARSLRECLRLQLTDPDRQSPYRKQALDVVDNCFKEFTNRRWDVIAERLKMDEETLAHVRHELTHLNPRPGSALGSGEGSAAPSVIPDFYVSVNDSGEPVVQLNNGEVPHLRVSQAFRDSIRQYGGRKENLTREQHDTYVYAREKVDAAQTFISLINRRRQTLTGVMEAIVKLQRDFFIENDDEFLLHPMTLREVAAIVGVDLSTVSRVTGNKYVQTDFGIYPLKFFFSSQFTTETGDELSARQVRNVMREIVDAEDKRRPLSDEAIAEELAKRGFDVARRTVAKYREQMNILPSRMRRK